ncbi:hypothetical protein KSB_71010 [Ktedonobacter robiniae]|uniref:Uncharacterized protein n=1 Tax=Ktedonobacter robiniae TaxID=2778365 RepID=A0ABQ3V0F7_9CHLR|nr:hypothetical protein KSB_71010 [Ktedonobacter robiniae]
MSGIHRVRIGQITARIVPLWKRGKTMTLSQAVPALRLRLYHSREKMQEYAGALKLDILPYKTL